MAYRITPFSITLSKFLGHIHIAGLFKCNF